MADDNDGLALGAGGGTGRHVFGSSGGGSAAVGKMGSKRPRSRAETQEQERVGGRSSSSSSQHHNNNRNRSASASSHKSGGSSAPTYISNNSKQNAQSKNNNNNNRRKQQEHQKNDEPLYPFPIQHNVEKYARGAKVDISTSKDKKYHRETKQREAAHQEASMSAAASELLLTQTSGYLEAEGPMEKTYKFTQTAIRQAVDIQVAKKSVELALTSHGPYKLKYSPNGRHSIVGGHKGHVAVIDWHKFSVKAEFHVGEPIYDVTFLHNSMLCAVAQQKAVYIYDHTGAEIHAMRNHIEPRALEFLPSHFLLASVGTAGYLKYQDVSTGELISEHRTKLGPCSVLRANQYNGVMALGHGNGVITMWTPNMSTPVAKMISHRGPVSALAIDASGKYMVTAGLDSRVKVWDIRRFQPVHDYYSVVPAHALDISQRGMVGVGFGSHVQIWGRDFALEDAVTLPMMGAGAGAGAGGGVGKASVGYGSGVLASAFSNDNDNEEEDDEEEEEEEEGGGGGGADGGATSRKTDGYLSRLAANAIIAGVTKARSPYLRHELPGRTVTSLRFRPYDDVCAIGHGGGISSIIVPGAGEPNYDSMQADPFQRKKARQEAEVHALLDKLPPTSITLNPDDVGAVDKAAAPVKERERKEEEAAAEEAAAAGAKEKKRKRRGIRKALKKQANIITEQRLALVERLKEETDQRKAAEEKQKKEKAKLLKQKQGGSGGGGGGGGGGSGGSGGKGSDDNDDDDNDNTTGYGGVGNGGGNNSSTKPALSRFYSKKEGR